MGWKELLDIDWQMMRGRPGEAGETTYVPWLKVRKIHHVSPGFAAFFRLYESIVWVYQPAF